MPADGGGSTVMAPASFRMTSDPLSVREGLRLALQAPPLATLNPADRSTAEIVLAEVLNNVVEHAYAAAPGPIRLWLDQAPGRLCCRIEDEGAPMPEGRLPAGRLPEASELAEGGFGWHLIRSLALDLHYERSGGTNLLCFDLPAEQNPD